MSVCVFSRSCPIIWRQTKVTFADGHYFETPHVGDTSFIFQLTLPGWRDKNV